ncbi:hypothetical protein DKX38_004246 [Salix brachista]|uniref:ribose-phosphate diphosphokinase n=1 Tax=Salix brachista TaxID=2182728 RepID=A0A5N5NAH4_9ROSI|nr:hypothetical protein DKX38_004246 [Salix brachista]
MSVPGVQAKQMERAMARSTSSARIASAREGTAKSIVADQVSHAVQSTTYLLHLIQQSSPSHVPPSLPSYMLIKILHAYCNLFVNLFSCIFCTLHLIHVLLAGLEGDGITIRSQYTLYTLYGTLNMPHFLIHRPLHASSMAMQSSPSRTASFLKPSSLSRCCSGQPSLSFNGARTRISATNTIARSSLSACELCVIGGRRKGSCVCYLLIRIYLLCQKCDISGPLNFGNGKPAIPVLNDQTLPKFLESARVDKTVNRNNTKLRLFSGTANHALSQEIAWYMGLELGKINIKRFADGEIYVQLQESVRGCDVFLLQPTCPPANENLMELLVMIDACRRASAKNITAVIPYFGYARADRKASCWRASFSCLCSISIKIDLVTQGRESIAAKLVANLITEAGANRVLACDLHAGQSMGYFDIPVDHVYGQPVILDYLASKTICSSDLVVVSPDVGGVARARAFAKKLSDAPLAIVDKRRHGHNVAEVMNLIGDVKGKVAVMVDDMIDTAGTIAKGAALLHEEGAREVYACCTHAVFSPPAIERLSSGLFQEVIITNTIPVAEKNYFPQLTVLSVANLLGETIWRVHDDCSVSSIFQ